MGQYVSAAFAIVLLALVTVSGMSLAGAFEARATLSTITVMAASDMSVDGGYTSAVQTAIQSALAVHGLNGTATVNVMVNNGTSGNTAWYGDTYTVSITYNLPLSLTGGGVTTSAAGVSTYPCTATQAAAGNCTAPAAIPGGSV